MKKISLIVILILIAASLLFFLWPKHLENKTLPVRSSKNVIDIPAIADTPERPSRPETKEIVYTDAGFNPSVLTIFSGDTIIFKNKSGKDFQPVGDPKNEMPFGSSLPIPKNKDYRFTFQTPGEYGYYNELDQSKFGAIVVK